MTYNVFGGTLYLAQLQLQKKHVEQFSNLILGKLFDFIDFSEHHMIVFYYVLTKQQSWLCGPMDRTSVYGR